MTESSTTKLYLKHMYTLCPYIICTGISLANSDKDCSHLPIEEISIFKNLANWMFLVHQMKRFLCPGLCIYVWMCLAHQTKKSHHPDHHTHRTTNAAVCWYLLAQQALQHTCLLSPRPPLLRLPSHNEQQPERRQKKS